jgi:hypothetical protein
LDNFYDPVVLEGVVQYRYSANGTAQQGVSVEATASSLQFLSPATSGTGIALANPYTNPVALTINALDSQGKVVAQGGLTLGGLAHQAFNLNQAFPSLASDFRGSVRITGSTVQTYFVALTLSGDDGC